MIKKHVTQVEDELSKLIEQKINELRESSGMNVSNLNVRINESRPFGRDADYIYCGIHVDYVSRRN